MESCKNMFRKKCKDLQYFWNTFKVYFRQSHMLYQLDQFENILVNEKSQEILLLMENVESMRLVDFV